MLFASLFWGFIAGFALVIGALVGYFTNIPQRVIAGIMAFGSGILISTLALELMEDAYTKGGFASTSLGFVGGALVYTFANIIISKKGAKHRKRSDHHQSSEVKTEGSGMALAVGALLDGIPESIVIGLSLLEGGKVSTVAVVAIFLSNIPESLSSATGMKKAGRSKKYIFSLWIGICLILSLASLAGFAIFSHFPPNVISATIAVAAGAILAMIADTMIPEAFELTHNYTGLITVLGFLAAFVLSKLQ
ncbi:MAG: zinc/iron permease [Segetibacter sp.]|nr:zinc/iron permease [Segetibacter sp.]